MHPHLTKGEAWLLRRINLHDFASGTFNIQENGWPPPEKTKQSSKEMPTNYREAIACVGGLMEHGLVEGYYSDKGWHAKGITGPGRECLWELDHPDIVEKIQDWARRSPLAAGVIIAMLTTGAACSFFKAARDFLSWIWDLLVPQPT
ncbi:MAG: hypothetical protein WCB27_02825 [Thermoguttaceae bacterium]